MSIQTVQSHHTTSSSSSSSSASTKRKYNEEDEKTWGVDEESPKALFNVEGLCNQIVFTLIDTHSTSNAANIIASTTPEILSSLSHYSLKELEDFLRAPIVAFGYPEPQEAKILKTLDILYTLSLRNSTYNGTTQTLESEINSYLKRTKTENFQQLILRAMALLEKAPKENREDLQRQIGEIGHMIGQITEVVDLYYFIDSPFKERVTKIYTDTIDHDGSPLFPNCRKSFGQFCQNLEVNRNARLQLHELRTQLLQKSHAFQQKLAPLLPHSTLPPERESLIKIEAVLFWEVGAQMLLTAFRNTFKEKWDRKLYIPSPLVDAINGAAKIDPSFNQYRFSSLNYNGFYDLPERFVDHVWVTYLGNPKINDVDEFMRHILQRLPEPTFQKLQADLTTSQDKKKTLLATLNEYFRQQIRSKQTFVSLKSWTQKQA